MKWYEKTKSEVPATTLAEMGLTPDAYMEQEYPITIQQALSPSQALCPFDIKSLEQMRERCFKPIEIIDNLIHIYQKFSIGETYVAFSDTSHGTGNDEAVTGVMNWHTGFVVACIQNNLLSPEEFAFQSVRMLNMYKDPLWGIEDNDWGILTIRKAQELGYKNFFFREWQKANRRVSGATTVGWHTDDISRTIMFGELVPAINNWQVQIPHESGLLQFFDCIRNHDKNGRIEAAAGSHDDFVLMCAGANQMRKYARVRTVNADQRIPYTPVEKG